MTVKFSLQVERMIDRRRGGESASSGKAWVMVMCTKADLKVFQSKTMIIFLWFAAMSNAMP